MRLLLGIAILHSKSPWVMDIRWGSRRRKNQAYTQNIFGVRVAILWSHALGKVETPSSLHMCKQGVLANPLYATPHALGGKDLWATPHKSGHHTIYLWSACDQQEVPVG